MRILLAIDLAEPALRARDLLASLSLGPGTTIRVVSVLAPMAVAYGGDAEAHVSSFQEEAGRPLEGEGRTVERAVLVGRPASVIIDEAAGADLVVVGSHGRGGLAELILGSTSAEIVAHAPVPVLVARSRVATRLLVADDGSPGAEAAADFVARSGLFASRQADVVSVVSVSDTVTGFVAAEALDEARRQHEERARLRAQALERAGFQHVGVHAPQGDPAREILDLAATLGADVVVMGTRGLTGLERLRLGSVARSVVHRAAASVLLAKARAA